MRPVKYPFQYIQKVAWGDMDAYGHINHLAYGKYFETARGYCFSESKIGRYILNSPEKQESHLGIPIITHLEMSFRQQVSFPSELEVSIGITNLKKRSFRVLCSIWISSQSIVTAKAEFLWLNKKKNQSILLPLEVFTELQNLQKRNEWN